MIRMRKKQKKSGDSFAFFSLFLIFATENTTIYDKTIHL